MIISLVSLFLPIHFLFTYILFQLEDFLMFGFLLSYICLHEFYCTVHMESAGTVSFVHKDWLDVGWCMISKMRLD